jgi:hypothetical protein
MYCAACGTGITPGLSFCNRCGFSLKERSESKTGPISAFLTAITIIGVGGLGIMLGGALALASKVGQQPELIGIFMLFTFFIVTISEILLIRQLSRLTGEAKHGIISGQQASAQNELPSPQARSLSEPIPSVTENTTRTLEYLRRDPQNR